MSEIIILVVVCKPASPQTLTYGVKKCSRTRILEHFNSKGVLNEFVYSESIGYQSK